MTPTEKRRLWNALFVATRNGYPGATYEAYDKPSDPRVRGGRWNWKQRDLIALYDKMVYYIESGQPVSAKLEILNYKTKFTQASLGKIIQAIIFSSPPVPPDVTPNPTPVWSNIYGYPSFGDWQYGVQQITGITVPITIDLTLNWVGSPGIAYYQINSTLPIWINGGNDNTDPNSYGFIPFITGQQFVINPGEYLSFATDNFGELGSIVVVNVSDSNTILNTVNITS